MRKLILFSAAFLSTIGLWAQQITGKVTNAVTGDALPSVNISITPSAKGTTTNAKGNFVIDVSNGTYKVTASFIGFASLTKEVEVSANTEELNFKLYESAEWLEQVNVSALRAREDAPIAYQNVSKEQIEDQNLGQDIPYILDQATSVVTTSDAGAGVGYSGLRIRGSSQRSINVTINGIPVNDGESHGVFWVNMPDLASSLQSVQIQRGVGTSTNGAGAFGASMNLQTNELQTEAFGQVHLGTGSFNTQRYTVQFGSGLINNHWAIQGRLSQIKSDGYVDRAASNLRSYFFTGGYLADNWSLKAVVFGGKERTYQAWYGVDSATYVTNPTLNYAGLKYDTAFNVIGAYEDQVDNYGQDHYQLHYNHKLNENWSVNLSGHHTKGSGYYEEYVQGDSLGTYDINEPGVVYGDLARRLWLDNDFYGAVYNAEYQSSKFDFIVGGAANKYDGDHFGEVIWARYAGTTEPNDSFYYSRGLKTDVNFYAKAFYRPTNNLELFGDIQYRRVDISGNGDDELDRVIDFEDSFDFINPKVGVTYNASTDLQFYASYAVSNREPTRQDYIENDTKPEAEQLQDVEVGTRYAFKNSSLSANLYGMFYKNQLVLTGELNNVGYAIRQNIGQSHRMGIEVSANLQLIPQLRWMPNITLSQNVNNEFIADDLTNYGETPIAQSPNVIAGSILEAKPLKGFTLALQNKYVGKQYLNNTGLERFTLPAYFLTHVRGAYQVPVNFVKSLKLEAMVNNVFDVKYASNGAIYGTTSYYYAQAGINFLAGVKIDF